MRKRKSLCWVRGVKIKLRMKKFRIRKKTVRVKRVGKVQKTNKKIKRVNFQVKARLMNMEVKREERMTLTEALAS